MMKICRRCGAGSSVQRRVIRRTISGNQGRADFPFRGEETAQVILNRNVIEPAVSTAKKPNVPIQPKSLLAIPRAIREVPRCLGDC